LYRRTRLENGLRVVTTTMPHARSVSTALFLGVGSRYESSPAQGTSHFVEHMLFKGTHRRPTAKDVAVAIEELGGILNAETGKEVTVYWNKVSQRHWSLAVDLLADVVRNSLFDPAEVEKERSVILEELSMLIDSPVDWVHLLIDEVLWGDHPLGRDVAGTRESVSAISRDELAAFASRHYSPDNAVLAVAGAVDHEAIAEAACQLFGDWRVQPPASWEPFQGVLPAPRVLLKHKETEQAHFCLGGPGMSYFDPDRFALDLLNVILGEGMSSRLFLEVRERHGLAYDVHSYVNRFRDTGSLVVYAGVDPPRIQDAIRAVLDEVGKLRRGIPDDEIVRAKEFWKGRMELRLEDTRSLASWLGSQELLLDRIYTPEEVVAQIDSVTHDDLLRVAAGAFEPGRLSLALIGPLQSDAPFQALLAP
jgi:predicted Zn-dependent peptidase